MIEKINSTCSICGKGYYKCLSCKDMITLNPWKMHTDTAEHYKIYQVIHGFNTHVYTKDEAKSKLQMIDLSDFDNLRDNIKNIINDIMGKNETMVDTVAEDKTWIETINLQNESKEYSNDEFVFEKSKMARKRKSFKTVETE